MALEIEQGVSTPATSLDFTEIKPWNVLDLTDSAIWLDLTSGEATRIDLALDQLAH